jgi:hypothetical protein
MPFIIILFGAFLVVAGLQGTLSELGTLLIGDLKGTNGFAVWMLAFFLIGSVGYVPKLKPLSDAFLFLIIVGIIFANDKGASGSSGFFANLTSFLKGTGGSSGVPTISGSLTSGGLYTNQSATN